MTPERAAKAKIEAEQRRNLRGLYGKPIKPQRKPRDYPRQIQVAPTKNLEPEAARERTLRNTYGFGLVDELKMIALQDGVCAVCIGELVLGNRQIDHCHTTFRIRGVLCRRCNRLLGSVQDSIAILKRAIAYLEMTAARPLKACNHVLRPLCKCPSLRWWL